MGSERDLENYLEIDHRDSPGFDGREAAIAGLRGHDLGAGKRLKLPTYSCNHCQRQLIVNPLRTRDRERCWKCHRYVCDPCKTNLVLTGVCYPWKQREDDWWNSVNRGIITL